MRRLPFLIFLLGCVLLCGCGRAKDPLQPAVDFRTRLLEENGCRFSAEVSADYGDRVYEFSLDCEYDGHDGSCVVTAPQSISGIAVVTHGEDCRLEFEDTVLDFGKLADGKAAPLSVPWLFGSAWQEDYIDLCGKDGDMDRVTIRKGYGENTLTVETWLRDGIPVAGEVSSDGRRILTVTMNEFNWGTKHETTETNLGEH